VFSATTATRGAELWVAPLDQTPPRITPALTGTRQGQTWTSDVTVSFVVEDPDSAVVSSGCATVQVTQDTPGLSLTCSALSEGGRASVTVVVRRDTTPPQLTCPDAVHADALAGVLLGWTVHDALDPAPQVTVPPLVDLPQQTVELVAVDSAGNRSTCTVAVTIDAVVPAPPPAVGCSCRAAPTGLPWTVLVALALFARRRRVSGTA
jgi:MYXO-CTERM domain-containing protein